MRLIIFDVDGTLVDSQHEIVAAQTRAFAAFDLPPPTRDVALSVVGLSLTEAFTALAGPDAPIAALAEAYKAAWLDLHADPSFALKLYPGAADLVAALGAQPETLLAIATGKSRRGVERLLKAQNWNNVFATIQTSDTHPSKPHPSMLREALDATGMEAGRAVMIGDTTYDMEMARAAGVRPIGVRWGYHESPALIAAGADAVAEDFEALSDLLGRLQREAA